jgi:uncharacterized protein (DUF1015 family)
MAEVLPFPGVRFNPDRIDDLVDVITPPYDVIYAPDRVELEKQHPNNIVRLILSQPTDQDTKQNNQYTRSANLLHQWINDGVLVQDDQPSYYIYNQRFILPEGGVCTRRALVAVGRLEKFTDRIVLPHEKTLAAPKADRLNLMRQTHAHLSPIFLLYSDKEGLVEREMLDFTDAHDPVVDLSSRFGATHQVWQMVDPEINDRIRQVFSNKTLLIADGHHRYETSIAFRDEIRGQAENWCGDEPYNYVMMNLVRMESNGLAVLPIHRLLNNLDLDLFTHATAKLSAAFEVNPFENLDSLKMAQSKLAGVKPAFGYYTKGDQFQLIVGQPPNETDSSLGRLDIKILHDQIIKGVFGVDTTNVAGQQKVSYKVDAQQAIDSVKSGEFQVAILPNPTKVEQVYDVALEGDTMPQKSTFFYPKLATGLTIHLMRPC